MQTYRKQLNFLRVISDILSLIISFLVGVHLSPIHSPDTLNGYELLLLFGVIVAWTMASKSTGLYDEFRSRNFSYELIAIFKNTFITAISAITLIFIFNQIKLSRIFLLTFIISSLISISLERFIIRKTLNFLRIKGRNLRNILIVGAGKVGWSFYETIKMNPHFGYKLVGFLDDKKYNYLNGEYLGSIKELNNILEKKRIDNVIIALPSYATSKLEEVMRICESYTTRVKVIPDYSNIFAGKYSVSMFGKFPILSFGEDKINDLNWRFLKRTFDTVVTIFVFAFIFSWLWPLIAITIKIFSPGPVFFKQERWGKNNKKFIAYKFRTMVPRCEEFDENGKFIQASPNDARITKIGKILRKTNLDELPQFINVLKGEMSIVGPRPHPTPLNLESKKNVKKYLVRHLVKPGITGWAQANGYRGETKDIILMQKRVEYDIWYIDNWSFWLDIQIIFLTVWRMLKGDSHAY